MAYRYRKPYRIKKKKSLLRSRFFWLAVLFLTAIGGISYLILFSGTFQIEKIIITGGNKVSEENIKALIPRKSLFLADIEEIEINILNGFPQIGKVEMRRSLPDTLNVLVIERLPIGLWCQESRCFSVDSEGVIFEENALETDLIKISGVKEMLNKEKIAEIIDIRGKLENGLGVTTTQAVIVSEERLNVKTSEGWEIYFNLKGNLTWQLQELALVLEKQIIPEKINKLEYIDLRFSRVFYK